MNSCPYQPQGMFTCYEDNWFKIMIAVHILVLIKYSFVFLGHLVMSCNQATFLELTEFLLTELGKNSSTSTTRTYIQCIGAITYV